MAPISPVDIMHNLYYIGDNYYSMEHDSPLPITSLRFNLAERSLTLESDEQPFARVTFSSGTIYFQSIQESAAELAASETAVETDSTAEATPPREKDPAVILTGKLLGRARQGRPNSQGHETAWARLAAHEAGREDAHVYSTTFHRRSARIALGLPDNADVCVEGFPHPSNDPTGKRLDTLSVFRFVPNQSEGPVNG